MGYSTTEDVGLQHDLALTNELKEIYSFIWLCRKAGAIRFSPSLNGEFILKFKQAAKSLYSLQFPAEANFLRARSRT
jgi:hypothetical protein